MDLITFILLFASLIGSLGLLAFAADRWGVDSRPTIGDSHTR